MRDFSYGSLDMTKTKKENYTFLPSNRRSQGEGIYSKGQVTVFIVLGIIIILAVGIFLYFRTALFEAQLALQQDAAEGEAVVVQNFVSTCLEDVATDALIQLGQQGGYINLSRSDMHNKDFVLSEDSTASDAVKFHGLDVPYWWYEDSEHDCSRCSITTKNVPSIENMEEQVAGVVAEQLHSCLGNFASLEEQGFTITTTAVPIVETIVSKESVFIQLQYPLSISKEGSITQLQHWYVEIPVPLQDIYTAATEVLTLQVRDQFLEQILINIISAYSGIDEEHLPPLAGFTEGYAVTYWIKSLVKEQLQQYLNTYIPLIQIQGSSAAVPLETKTEYGKGFFTMLFRESTYPFGSLAVDFIYDNFDYYLEISPSKGDLLTPESYTQEFPLLLPSLQTNHYRFFYDVSYPVIVSIRDESALNGEGYTFFFALEANMRDNRNLIQWAHGKGTFGDWDSTKVEVALKSGVPTEYPAGFDLETNQTIYATTEEPKKTLFCSASQRMSGEVSVSAYDGTNGEPLSNAAVAFRCGTYETCSIGSTNSLGKFEEHFPVCIGGVAVVSAEGYATTFVEMDTMPEQENTIIALLEPIKEVSVAVKLIPSSRLSESLSSSALRNLAFDLDRTESVLLTVEKVPDNIYEIPSTQVVSITEGEEATLQMVSGSYLVSGILLDEEGVIIPARNDTVAWQTIEYPEINMTPAMLGAVYLDETSAYWNVESDVLQKAKSVLFYLFRANDPVVIEDLAELGNFTDYSLLYRDVVEPGWE